MSLLEHLIAWSVRNRLFVALGVLVFLGVGIVSFQRMTFDAFPDLTNVQVQVLTSSPGMGSEEIELLVTLPVERALGGTPGLVELRSLSRTGVSAITAVFEDGTPLWLARQQVQERLVSARDAIPDSAGSPEMAPPSTGLGEVYQFTLSSDRHSPPELYRIFERDVAPRLQGVEGVVGVNAWGGGAPRLEVIFDPFALAAVGMTPAEAQRALSEALGLRPGGAMVEGGEQALVRAVANPAEPAALEEILLRQEGDARVLVRDVAQVREGGAPTVGLGSTGGRGESMFVMVQLLAGADALGVVRRVRARAAEVQVALPEGVQMEVVYDREVLVGSTLKTVATSLAEGGLLVIVVLFLLLGDLRAGLLTASVIPLAMLGAFTGLNALGYSGNLMSLGAIDFGLIVDGTIVVTEGIVALSLGAQGDMAAAVTERASRVARPVLFAIGILLLVYTPILLMWGVEGKLFRPMALTVLLALGTALVLTFTYIPAMATWVLRPRGDHQPWLARRLQRLYQPALVWGLSRPWWLGGAALALLLVSVAVGSGMGVEFVPRLEEGDLVVQTTRLPSLSPEQALREATRVEASLMALPEVEVVASRTGSPALATDPMGLEEADILVKLKPKAQWRTASTTEGLMAAVSAKLEREAPGAELNLTQPIEMRFSELLEGITSDVGVKIYGPDREVLVGLAQQVAGALEETQGAADVTPPAQEGVPGVQVTLREERLARYGLSAQEVLGLVGSLRRGEVLGSVVRGQFQDEVVGRVALPAEVPLGQAPVVLPGGRGVITLEEVADVSHRLDPVTIEREAGSRRVVVEANVRGRDVGGFVQEARARVEREVKLPDGYWLAWSGKYEQLQAAAWRAGVMIPAVLFLMLGVLYLAFGGFKPALLIFLNVPVAVSGGVLILWLRGLPLSMSAIVGFIALFGVAVMNGIVMISRTEELRRELGAAQAAHRSALERFRPVLMTAFVAGIGFVPMALATGIGAEVQRPLATVVIGGLLTSTPLTLLVLPALYGALFGGRAGGGVDVAPGR
jgi:cobalt-zinc-cadmium resistance protein CzcA